MLGNALSHRHYGNWVGLLILVMPTALGIILHISIHKCSLQIIGEEFSKTSRMPITQHFDLMGNPITSYKRQWP